MRVVKGQVSQLVLGRSKKPASAVVSISRDRDAVSVASAAACTIESNRITYNLAAQSSVSRLTATFTITETDSSTSTVVVPVEVVGARVCSVADCRRLRPLDDVNRYSDDLLEAAITSVETALEAACGVSFVPVEKVNERYDGSGTTELYCRHGHPQSFSAVSMSDSTGVVLQTLTSTDISGLIIDNEAGVVIRPTFAWPKGRRNVTVTGVFGMENVPGMVAEAVAKQIRYMLIDSPTQDRAVSVTSEDGTTQSMIVAGLHGNHFAIPEMNQIVQQYGQAFGVA